MDYLAHHSKRSFYILLGIIGLIHFFIFLTKFHQSVSTVSSYKSKSIKLKLIQEAVKDLATSEKKTDCSI